jgi:hypothetical protein
MRKTAIVQMLGSADRRVVLTSDVPSGTRSTKTTSPSRPRLNQYKYLIHTRRRN